jgi:hypothetical protein
LKKGLLRKHLHQKARGGSSAEVNVKGCRTMADRFGPLSEVPPSTDRNHHFSTMVTFRPIGSSELSGSPRSGHPRPLFSSRRRAQLSHTRPRRSLQAVHLI